MALPNVNFTIETGGLGRFGDSADGVSALVFYGNAGPSGFGDIERVRSLKAAEALGITAAWQLSETYLSHYYIEEFFRLNPEGDLYLCFYDTSGTPPTLNAEIERLQAFASGRVKLMGLVNAGGESVETALLTALGNLETGKQPISLCLTDATITRADAAKRLMQLTGQDRATLEAITSTAAGASLPAWAADTAAIGTALGLLSRKQVHQSLAHPATSNVAFGTKFSRLGFVGGALYVAEEAAGNLATRNDAGEVFLRTFPNYEGVYFNDDFTRALATSDFAPATHVRVIDKALRELDAALTPQLHGEIGIDRATGELFGEDVDFFTAIAQERLDRMTTAGEISSALVIIDPKQNILSTETLEVRAEIVPIGSASTINVTLALVNPAL